MYMCVWVGIIQVMMYFLESEEMRIFRPHANWDILARISVTISPYFNRSKPQRDAEPLLNQTKTVNNYAVPHISSYYGK